VRRQLTFRPRLESLEDRVTPSTIQLTNQNFVDGPKYLTPVGSTLYFEANNGNGEQLWRTDGGPGDAVPVQSGSQPVDPGGNGNQQVAQIGPWLYFFSVNTDGTYTLWRNNSSVNPTGGTSPSQALVTLDADPTGFGPYQLTAVGHDLYFGAYSVTEGGDQLWKVTGADGGNPVTAPFLYAGADANGPNVIKTAGSNLYFSADFVHNGTRSVVLYGSDGTIAGTAPIQDGSGGYVPGPEVTSVSQPGSLLNAESTSFATVGSDLYYINGAGGGSLWKISGPGAAAEQIASSTARGRCSRTRRAANGRIPRR
jgi:ELWxxDGT repeat protein